jgi:hypothetical protein
MGSELPGTHFSFVHVSVEILFVAVFGSEYTVKLVKSKERISPCWNTEL